MPEFLLWIIAFVIAVSFHEAGHALVAYLLGDATAKHEGRITLNPLRHLDIFGFLFLLYAHFGWAKPVPVNARNFEYPRLYMALTAAAGPFSNLLLAYITLSAGNFLPPSTPLGVIQFFQIFFLLNILLATFNLIPLKPLDGESILALVIPKKLQNQYERVAQYGPLILFGAIGISFVFHVNILSLVLFPLANYLAMGIEFLVIF